MNPFTASMASFLVFALASCRFGLTMAEEAYPDDIYHCADPTSASNPIPCNPTNHKWNLNVLDPNAKPDESALCNEIVKVLVRAKENEGTNNPGQVEQTTQKNIQLWESIMQNSVVDKLEPCVLWAMSFGPLQPWAKSMGAPSEITNPNQHSDIRDNSDPISSLLEIEFDPIVIALAWQGGIQEPLSLDRTELHDITGRHMMDALKAELGPEKVEYLDLTVTAGLPDYQANILPLTLSGKVVFRDHREALGPSNLQRVILQTTFVNVNARDLYLFRLKIANDLTLQQISTVLAGRDAVADYILQPPQPPNRNYSQKKPSQQLIDTSEMDLSEENQGFVSFLLVAILSAVGAAILAVICFAYFLLCRSKTSGHAAKTLEEHSLVGDDPSRSGRSARSNQSAYRKVKKGKETYQDGVPAVQTAPTDVIEEGDEYDIEYVAGSQVDDGVSEYEMDTLPPPSTLPSSDDDQSVVMSVMEGFDDENLTPYEEEQAKPPADASDDDANTSLYSYIPDDTSLSSSLKKEAKSESSMERKKNKGLLWSVMKKATPNNSDTDNDGSVAQKSILGPSGDDESKSHDSSLLYVTDDDEQQRWKEPAVNSGEEPPPESEQPEENMVDSTGLASDLETADKKKKFEDLWKDENEIDEAASVLNYLDSVQAARREAEAEAVPLTSSLKIVDVATPVQTPERPPRSDSENVVQNPAQHLADSLVDRVPESTDAEDDQMNLPLPASLESKFQDGSSHSPEDSSVSSDASGSSTGKSRAVVGESARQKKSNKWAPSSPAVASSGSSVCSTDSSKLRSLLGQSDTNDAALVFGKQSKVQQKDDNSTSSNSNATPEAEVSMSSCTSGQLKSLLTTDGLDTASDDEPEDFLFHETPDKRRLEEEKKEDKDDLKTNYLPASITPRGVNPPREFGSPDDVTVLSALSEAPSVDATIKDGMGWF